MSLCLVALLAGAQAGAEAGRHVSKEYSFVGSGCPGPPSAQVQCFDIEPGETTVRDLDYRIGGFVEFDGFGGRNVFCDERTFAIPPGAVVATVFVGHGWYAGACPDAWPVAQHRPTLYGRIDATFYK